MSYPEVFGSIVPPHQHFFIVSEGVRICSTCGAYPNERLTIVQTSTVSLNGPAKGDRFAGPAGRGL